MRQSLLPGMANSLKKVVLRRWNQEWLHGYLPPASFVRGEAVELLELGGKILPAPLADLKWICFVRDFNSGEIANPERLLRKTFAGRPRTAGLWIRARLTDGDLLEGIADNDLSLLTSAGLFLTPPDTRSNTQRIFLPTPSIAELEVLSVIGLTAKTPSKSQTDNTRIQPDLFGRT
jgi:hypothetical protein